MTGTMINDRDIVSITYIGHTSKLDKQLSTDSPFVSVDSGNDAIMPDQQNSMMLMQ